MKESVDMEIDLDEEMEYLDRILKSVQNGLPDENNGMVGLGGRDDISPDEEKEMVEDAILPKGFEVDEKAYYGMGTWLLNNWRTTREFGDQPVMTEDKYDGDSGGEYLNVESVAMLTPNLTLFSIVGRPGGTRKRPYGKTGSWWAASGWGPGTRRSTARRAKRRIVSEEGTSQDIQEDMMKGKEGSVVEEQLEIFSLLSDKIEISTDCRAQDINVTGEQEQHQQHVRDQVAMEVTILDRPMEEQDHAMKFGSRYGRHETVQARNRISSKSTVEGDSAQDKFVAGVTGSGVRDHPEEEGHADAGVQGGDHEAVHDQGRATQDYERVKYKPFQSLMSFWKGYCGEEHDKQLLGNDGGQDDWVEQSLEGGSEEHVERAQIVMQETCQIEARLQASGELVEVEVDCEEYGLGGEHDAHPVAGEQHALVGDGFHQQFRKITRAGRKCKVPDGRFQMLLDNFVVKGGEGASKFGVGVRVAGKKRSAECELNLRIKKARN